MNIPPLARGTVSGSAPDSPRTSPPWPRPGESSRDPCNHYTSGLLPPGRLYLCPYGPDDPGLGDGGYGLDLWDGLTEACPECPGTHRLDLDPDANSPLSPLCQPGPPW